MGNKLSSRPVVFIHGAYQGGWIWKLVAARLAAEGRLTLTPTLDGCAERAGQLRAGITTESHAEEMAELLRFHDLSEVTLVSTSSGGMVAARVAELARPRIGRLVFADSLMLMSGEKIRDIVTRPAAINTDLALGPSREDARNRLLAGLDPELAEWAADRFTLHPEAVFNQPVTLESFWDQSWDADVLYCTQAANPGEAHLRRGADRLKARWHVLDTGHYPMLSMPDAVADIITGKATGSPA